MALKFRAFCVLALCAASVPGRAQLVVNAGVPAATVVQDVLVGEGVVITNITFSGVLDQIGTFDAANSNILVPDGMIMATGTATLAVGPNNSGSLTLGGGSFGVGDPDLQAISVSQTGITAGAAVNLEVLRNAVIKVTDLQKRNVMLC